ncbi:MAG: hypothetical protein ACJAVO_002009 [Parvibaculaceae bacterium]|jgi:hypothetical protein
MGSYWDPFLWIASAVAALSCAGLGGAYSSAMGQVTCKCGAVFIEKRVVLSVRKNGVSKCSCGEELQRWNGKIMYSHMRLPAPKKSKLDASSASSSSGQ